MGPPAARRRVKAAAAQDAGVSTGTSSSSSDSDSPTAEGTTTSARAAAAAASSGVPRRRPARRGQRAAELLPLELAELHTRDNPHILHWYRPRAGFRRSLASLFSLHNETGNVWSHLLGFLIFVALTAATVHLRPEPLRLGAEALARLEHQLYIGGKSNLLELVQTLESWEKSAVRYGQSGIAALEERLSSIRQENLQDLLHVPDAVHAGWQELSGELSGVGSRLRSYGASAGAELASVEAALHDALAAALEVTWPVPRWPIYVFTAGAMLCLLTSSVCHLFGCCAAHIAAVLWRFDYAGIAVLIVASFFPPIHYGFLCSPWTRLFYLATTCALGAVTLCVTFLSVFQRPEFHRWRALIFCSLGLWGIVPIFHGWYVNWGVAPVAFALGLDLLMGAIYLAGAGLYAARLPERLKPGAFDVAGNSHQLFHLCVVVAACVHYKAVRVLLAWRDATGGCLPPLPADTLRPLPPLLSP